MAAVAKAAGDAVTVEYASAGIARAKDILARMQNEVAAKNYEVVKTLSQEAIQAAEKAITDGLAAKAKARDDANTLLSTQRAALTEARKALADASAVRGIQFDKAAIERDIGEAERNITSAGTDIAAENFRAAGTKAQTARALLAGVRQRLADATQAATRKK